MRRIVVLTRWGCEGPFRLIGKTKPQVVRQMPSDVSPDDLLILEGGTDISPSFYGETRGAHTHFPDVKRDARERAAIRQFVAAKAPILGICRGAQLMTAFVGAKLAQHVTGHGHGSGHLVVTTEGQELHTASLHHQMMLPFSVPKEKYEILAWTPQPLSVCYLNGEGTDLKASEELPENFVEPEVVWYPEVKALCIQGHPEYMHPEAPFVKYSRQLVERYLLS